MARLFDVRTGEAKGSLAGFSALLLLIIAAHTILEMARDALLLTGPGPRALGLVYAIIALGTVPGAAIAARIGERYGQRRALGASLAVAIAGPIVLFVVPMSHVAATATYVLSGLLGSIVVPQFWMLVGTVLTVAQGRRLFGLISAAGILGGVLGPAASSVALLFVPVRGLLLASSFVFAVAATTLALARLTERAVEPAPARRIPLLAPLRAFRDQPFLGRVALVVFLSTATFLTLDYLFKSSIARAMPSAEVGPFVAHYYFGLNCLSLVAQVFATGAVVRRLGVLSALVVTPMLMVGGAVTALLGGGAFPGVLLAKGIDGSLRFSIHRVTGELMYLPVPVTVRQRVKPFIDGTLARAAQTMTGMILLALGGTKVIGPRPLALAVAVLAAAWLATVLTMRRSYLALLRSAITVGSFDESYSHEPLDLDTAQLLVQRLANEDPLEVEGAIAVLSRHARGGLIPALVLLHRDEGVLVHALEVFGESSRTDWFAAARRLLGDPREAVRVAAARALARHEQLDAASLAHDLGWRARGYAAVRMALRDADTEVTLHTSVASLLDEAGERGSQARLGLLAAIADSPRTSRLSPLLHKLAHEPRRSREHTELLALAAASQQDPLIIPPLVSFLAVREGREAVRAALVSLGSPALEEVRRTLRDPTCPRRLRLHMPKTLARFATRRAGDSLLEAIETQQDGLVRYKAIRALRVLVTEHRIFVDRGRVERLACADLEQSFRRLASRLALELPPEPMGATHALLHELLNEKAAHAVERAFHLLQIAHPRQGVHHAYIASRSDDPSARANGAELIDALLRHSGQQKLRSLFRLATDDLSAEERVSRARALGLSLPSTRDEGLDALLRGKDVMLVALGRRLQAPAADTHLAQVIPLTKVR